MDPGERSRQLTSWALELGFDRAGVAALGPASTGDAYLAWLARGDQAGMDYLARRVELRLDPRRLLPGARSAVCVALHYAPLAGELAPAADLWSGVARYARGRAYHNVMERRLRRLAERRDLDLAGLLGLGEKAYRDRFRGSPMQRARREGLQRNAAVALGNRGRANGSAALIEALREGEPLARRHAAWPLGRLGSSAGRRALGGALASEADGAVRSEIAQALATWGGGKGADAR